MLNGIQRFLQMVNDNWTTILVILGLALGLYKKITDYFNKSDEEKIEIAKKQIQETILRMITSAEIDFADWNEAGKIKRSLVIENIMKDYPVLSKITSQDEIIGWIDNQIDESLKTLRKIVEVNKDVVKPTE